MTLSRWYTSVTFRGKYMCVTEIRLYRIRIFGGEKKDYCDKVNKIKTLLQDTKQKYDRNRRSLPGEELLVFTRFPIYGDGHFSVLTDLKIPDDTCLPGLLKNQCGDISITGSDGCPGTFEKHIG